MLKPEDIMVDTYRSSKRSGLRVGVDYGVKVTHKPTGIFVVEDSERSQHRNRELALQKLDKLVADAQTTGAAELPQALRLADELRKMDEAKKYHPSGPGGQMLGCEQYRLVASGFTFEHLQSAAAELRRLHAQVAALTAAPQGVAYAELPEKYYLAGGEVPTGDAKQMHAFADATHALRTTPVPNPAEIEHGAGDVSKTGAEANTSTQQTAPATQQAGEVSVSHMWRCFHCEEVFMDKDSAALHFGSSERQQAYCTIPVEHFRWLEEQQRRYFEEEDTESHRTIRALHSQSFENARRSEERGYARGLEDAKKYPQELGLTVAPHAPTPQADSVLEDAARLDWLALAGPTSICLVIDRPHDGEIEVATDDVTGYGKTLREALDAARKQGGA